MTEPAVVEILRKARYILRKPEYWTQGSYARDAEGNELIHDSPDAVCWCAIGATYSAAQALGYKTCKDVQNIVQDALDVLHEGIDYAILHGVLNGNNRELVSDWNDVYSRKHDEVLIAFDYAIEYALEGKNDIPHPP